MGQDVIANTAMHITDATKWVREVWDTEIHFAASEEMRVLNHYKRLQAFEGKIHWPKHATFGVTALGVSGSKTARGVGLNYNSISSDEVTAESTVTYCAVGTSKFAVARLARDPNDQFRKAVELALAEGADSYAAGFFTSLSQVLGGAGQNTSEATLLDGIANFAKVAKSRFTPGSTRLVYLFTPLQIDDVLSTTQNWSQYQMTGKADGPVSTGWLKSVYGVDFIETGSINLNAGNNTAANGLIMPDMTFGVGWNQETTVKYEEIELSNRIIGWNDFGCIELWDEYGMLYTTTSA
jgi:hypothetical protein